MAGRAINAELVISEVTVNLDTGKVTGVGRLPVEGASAAHSIAQRYSNIAKRLLNDDTMQLHIGYDPALVSANGASGRFVAVLSKTPSAQAALWRTVEADTGARDLLVVFGPEFSDWVGDDDALEEIVAVDLTTLVETLYPIICDGPIKIMMPYLTQIAGNILLAGGNPHHQPPDPDGGERVMPSRVEKAIGRAYRSFAETHIGAATPNMFGRLLTNFPAWQFLADSVAREASSRIVPPPMNISILVYSIRAVIAAAVERFEISVVPAEPVP